MSKILILLAVFPAIFLITYVYHLDKIEKEPKSLLFKLVLAGAFSIIPVAVVELIFLFLFDYILAPFPKIIYTLFLTFIGIGLVEEGFKLFFLKKLTWKNPNFNYMFDGVIYAVCVSMGFALLENVQYVLNGGFGIAISRAIFSIPGHFIFSVYMGEYYAIARLAHAREEYKAEKSYLILALIIPALLHGFYDFCALSGADILVYAFLFFVIMIDIRGYKLLKSLSKKDTFIA